jgi:LmbE family N-acetylglucosaminyl deacetylase
MEMMATAGELLTAARSFPFVTLGDVLGERGLIVVAPHPDDESLACGGLIAEACNQGRPVWVIVVSDGAGSHPESKAYPPERLRRLREAETKRAVLELGLDPNHIVFLRLPDRFVSSEGPAAEEAIEKMLACAAEVGAGAMFVSWRHDAHCDHQASYRLVREVQRRVSSIKLYEYTVWGAILPPSTPIERFSEGFRICIRRVLAKKRRAIAAHRSQKTDLVHDDPNGFRLTAADLARFDDPFEFFFRSPE